MWCQPCSTKNKNLQNYEGKIAARWASMNTNIDVLKLFLRAPKVKNHTKDNNGKTAIMMAIDTTVRSLCF